MGIFGSKKKGNADAGEASEAPVKPAKKGFFGGGKAKSPKPGKSGKKKKGKKADMTHVEMMGLNESVADAVYSDVFDQSNEPDTAIRPTQAADAFIIVAITNDMFIEADIDKADEQFGAFASALEQSTIRSVTLSADLEAGVIGIIPDRATLEALDEYDFANDLNYRWALLDMDIQDDGSLTLLDNGPSLGDLFSLSADQALTVQIENSQGYIINEDGEISGDVPDDQDDDEFVEQVEPTPTYNTNFDDDEFADPGDDAFDDSPDEDEFEDEYPETDETPVYAPVADNFGGEPDDQEDELDMNFDDEVYTPQAPDALNVYDEVTPEDARDAIERVTEHTFSNSELSLSIDTTRFDDYFNQVEPKQFDTSMVRNSEDKLEKTIYNMRSEANAEMARYHDDAVASLRTSFISRLRQTHDQIVETMDHYKKDGQYGRRFDDIEQTYRMEIKNLDKTVSGETRQLRELYNENRENIGEAARQEAMLAYDSRHKQTLDEQIIHMKDRVSADVEAIRDASIAEMHQDRRRVASQLFDKAMTSLLISTQNDYNKIANTSLLMFDKFRKDHDVFLKTHYQDEVLRQKAEAAAIRQSDEVAATRTQFEGRLEEKQAALDEADARYRAAQVKFEKERRAALERQADDFERDRLRDKEELAALQKALVDQTASTQQLIENAVAEHKGRASALERQVSYYKTEVDFARDRETNAKKPSWVLYAAVAAVTLVLGLAIGAAYGISSANVAPSTASKTVGWSESFDDSAASVFTGVAPVKAYSRAA